MRCSSGSTPELAVGEQQRAARRGRSAPRRSRRPANRARESPRARARETPRRRKTPPTSATRGDAARVRSPAHASVGEPIRAAVRRSRENDSKRSAAGAKEASRSRDHLAVIERVARCRRSDRHCEELARGAQLARASDASPSSSRAHQLARARRTRCETRCPRRRRESPSRRSVARRPSSIARVDDRPGAGDHDDARLRPPSAPACAIGVSCIRYDALRGSSGVRP